MDEKVFKFHWLDGKTEIGKGKCFHCFYESRLQWRRVNRALDYYEEEKDGPTQN